MLWAFLSTAAVGLAIGLRFQVPFLMTSTIVLSVATAGIAAHLGWSISYTIITIISLIAVHQCSYLIGLFASSYLSASLGAKTRRRQENDSDW